MAIPGYRILRKIRQGGMSTVYLAIQKSVEREVAIKVMSPSLSSDPSFGSRFYREAKIVGQLSHHHIVSIYDVGSYKHYNYIAMDYLPGAPLQDQLDNEISDEKAVRVVREIASALDYAHQRGYIHRDIKPDNILFRADGSAVLCDFGIAKALKGNIKMTNIGAVLGTPHYMSPEQAQGKEIDGRADIYSLGVVFFEILTGQVPYPGDDPIAVAVKHMTAAVPKLRSEHKLFQPIIDKMMDKKACNRFQTGQEVIEALDLLETSISNRGHNPTQTRSTTIQVLGLAGALCSTLVSAISLSFKRLMLANVKFNSSTAQLSKQQQADLDTFILNDHDGQEQDLNVDDLALIQDTIEQPPVRYNWRWLYWPIALVCTLVGIFIYVDEQHPKELQAAYNQVAYPEISSINTDNPPPTAATPIRSAVIKPADKEPVEAEKQEADVNEAPPETTFALTINTVPSNATVRIINIKPKYSAGIMLPPGAYHIAVKADDYFPQRLWLRISDKDIHRTIALEPTQRLLAAGSRVVDKLADGSEGPVMIVLPQQTVQIEQTGQSVSVNRPLAIGQNEITFKDYDLFAQRTNRPLPNDYGWGRNNRPVIDVSIDDARAYAHWLSEQTQQRYRLPSPQEWEYAARGGQGTTFWWGNGSAKTKANCRKGCKSQFSKLFNSSTAPVGSYQANNYGLHDNAGNVAEWLDSCQQWSTTNEAQCLSALVAGGSHQDSVKKIKPEYVKAVAANKGSKAIGFRLVLEL